MVTMNQLQRGITEFIDREVIPHLSGFERIVVGGGAGLIAAKLPAVMDNLMSNPIVSALSIYDKSRGEVDIDAVYTAVKPYIGNEVFPVKIPIAGVTLKMSNVEIAKLVQYIKEG